MTTAIKPWGIRTLVSVTAIILGISGYINIRKTLEARVSPVKVTRGIQCRITRVNCIAQPKIEAFSSRLAELKESGACSGLRIYHKTRDFPRIPFDTRTNSPRRVANASEYGFDLWQIAGDLNAPPNSAIALSFDLESPIAQHLFLGLGSSHQYVVLNNGQPVYATLGFRTLLFNEDICEIDVQPGKNTITLVFQRLNSWTQIPNDHFEPEWSAEIQIFDSPQAAWENHRKGLLHPLDVAIVPSVDQFRVEAVLPGHETAKLYTLDGEEYLSGSALSDGSINWHDPSGLKTKPFFGFFVLDNDFGEPVVVLGDKSIDAVVESHLSTKTNHSPETGAWRFRLGHLLKPEFRKDINRTWTRKVVQALTKVVAANDIKALDSWYKICPSLRIKLHAYLSAIDGTTQYFHLFECSKRDGKVPLAVCLPPVPENVRPYLESASVANLPAFENLAVQAEQMNVDLLWPGLVDVDYGGQLCQKTVAECLGAYNQIRDLTSAGGIYLSGICSSGVSAINISRTARNIDGVILHTPVILRNVAKIAGDAASFDTLFPPDALATEAAKDDYNHFKDIPTLLIYDTEMFGHGDRQSSQEFERSLRKLGADIESHWPTPWVSMPWGERDNGIMRQWMSWMHRQEEMRASRQRHRDNSGQAPTKSPGSVKEALLQGFFVEPTADPVFSKWLASWQRSLALYRGSSHSDVSRQSASTQLSFHILTRAEINYDAFKATMPGNAVLEKNGLPSDGVVSTDVIFGIRLSAAQAGGINRVEILRSNFGEIPPPTMDPILDGHCRGALWKYNRDVWVLVDVWL